MTTIEIEDTAAAERASGSSFYTAMRILPRAQRQAMFEIYSFCRQVDDIADARGPRPARSAALERWRADIDSIYAGRPAVRVRALARAVDDFGLDQADLCSVIDGMEMDVLADIRAPSQQILDTYCDRVASAVGRLSVRVFGMERASGIALAHHLGRALQLTNILRDLDEDADFGRLYLPAEALRDAGIATGEPSGVLAHPGLGTACAALARQARAHFADADRIMRQSPRRTVRAPRIMAKAYALILDRLEARGWSPPRRPVRIPKSRLAWIIMRHAFF